jgi:HK97 family phage major capsid protein
MMRLSKLMGIVPLTDELIEDVASLPSYAMGKLGESIRWKTNDAIFNGTGAGMPAGIANAAALVTVLKESGQAANTFVAANAAKMFARMPASYLNGAVWVVNPEILPQLITMTLGNQPIWTPPSEGMKNAPGGYLLGKPIMQSQVAQALSAKGDVYFVNLKQYRTISKSGGVQVAQSMHLYFDAGLTAFRATFRLDGQPKFKQAITPAKGSATQSPYITLEAR